MRTPNQVEIPAAMMRLFLMMLATVALVTFALANTERVELSFLFGQTETRLIFLLATAFAAGATAAHFYLTLAGARRRAQQQRMRVAMERAALKELEAE
jgi:uncharacterized integral membrane protein